MLTTVVLIAALGAPHEPVLGRLSFTLDGGEWEAERRSSKSVSGSAAVALFFPRVVDDEAPLSLQPFLQNVSSVSASAGASGFSTRDPLWPDSYDGRSVWGSMAVSYNSSASAGLHAAVTVERLGTTGPYPQCTGSGLSLTTCSTDHVTRYTTLAFGPSLRLGDTRVALSLRGLRTSRDDYPDDDHVTVDLAVQSVVAQRVNLRGEAWRGTDQDGLSTFVNVYWTRAFQTGVGAQVRRDYFPEYREDRVAGSLDVSYWVTSSTRVEAEYTISRSTRMNGTGSGLDPLTRHTLMLATVVYLD